MENSILNNIGFDPGFLIIGLSVLTLISLIVTIICLSQYKKLYRRYDMFMRGKDAETLEDTILDLMDEAAFLRSEDRANKDLIESMEEQVKAGYQKTGIVKYNAFKGMGGNLSFVMRILIAEDEVELAKGICFELRTQQGRLLPLYERCCGGENGSASGK